MGIPTQKDADQVLRYAFDDATNAIRVDATLTNPANGTPGDPAPAEAVQVGGVDTNGDLQALHLDASANLLVNVASSALPTGAATEATSLAIKSDLDSLNARLAGGFVPAKFDETVITYVGITTDISTVTYKLAGSTVAVLTMTYDGSSRLIDVVKT